MRAVEIATENHFTSRRRQIFLRCREALSLMGVFGKNLTVSHRRIL